MRILILIVLFLPLEVAAQTFIEKEVKTDVKEVTVFLNAAQIFRSGAVAIPAGNSILRVKGLSPFMDEKSLQVKAEGDFTILSVNHKSNYLDELSMDGKGDSLRRLSEAMDSDIIKQEARLAVLKEKLSVLNANKDIGGVNSGVSVVQLRQTIDFYDGEITKIKTEEIFVNKKLRELSEQKSKLDQQISEISNRRVLPSGEAEVRINSTKNITTTLHLTYVVSNAGWYPKYDVRVENIRSPLQLTYKAEVFQNTGVDWKNVKLRFSNGDPNQSGVVPELRQWNLTYARNTVPEPYGLEAIRNVRGIVVSAETGESLPGVNVLVKGTSIGTVTDANGRFSLTLPNNAQAIVFSFIGLQSREVEITRSEMNVQLAVDVGQLNEVVVTGYASDRLQGRAAGVRIRGINSTKEIKAEAHTLSTTIVENQTTVEIEVTTPYSIKSNGGKLQVDLRRFEIDALYEYYAIPKLDKDAFLIARIMNWDQYNLLEGEANLYFEDGYVGRSVLDAKSLQDTLNISLGRDRNIVISREKNKEFSKRRAIGSNVIETRNFEIIARNRKSQPVKLTIFDQIPVSVVSDIIVSPLEISSGKLDTKTGEVAWELKIDPQQQKEISLQYEVKYPKRERVILE